VCASLAACARMEYFLAQRFAPKFRAAIYAACTSLSRSLTPSHTVSHRLTPSHTVSHRLAPSRTVSHRLTPSHTVSHRLTPSHTVSHRLTPSHRYLEETVQRLQDSGRAATLEQVNAELNAEIAKIRAERDELMSLQIETAQCGSELEQANAQLTEEVATLKADKEATASSGN
jgi:uncharacterized small protein (DUF1192 family)